jgi:hypothetical protein
VKAGGITQLVALLSKGSPEAKKYSAGALWHLNSVAENKEATFNAGAIPPLVAVLNSKSGEAREYASGVLSSLARTQGGTKAAIAKAGGIAALVKLLADVNMVTQRHSACALWGLSDGKDGIYDKEITKCGAVQPLIELLQDNNPETRGFAAACLLCLCNDPLAKQDILEQGGAEPLLAFAHGPPSWLSKQCTEMLGLLNVPLGDPDSAPTLLPPPPPLPRRVSRALNRKVEALDLRRHAGKVAPHAEPCWGVRPPLAVVRCHRSRLRPGNDSTRSVL